jgi:predicted metal-dependent HD superfamily phosphohydrolase
MDNPLQLIQDAQAQVTDLLENKLSKSIKFHTLQHTQEVVAACQIMADYFRLGDEDRFALILAAWFHDTGYTAGESAGHEDKSIELANVFMNNRSFDDNVKQKVVGCINATRLPQSPANFIEQIICDADLFHLGTDSFDEKSRLLRKELIDFGGADLSKKDWRKINIRFLERHEYFTAYAKEKLQPVKEKHLVELKEKKTDEMKVEKKDKDKPKDKTKADEQQAIAEAKAKKDKANQTERGINTVFRIMAQNQNNLSGMADSKANILISVNAIILSIIISTLSKQLEANPNLRIPILLLVTTCVSAIVFAILATRPNTNHGKFTQEDVKNKKTNLLFFGNFFKMGLHDYDWAMQEMLSDKDYLYSSVVKDIYFLGVVLAKKYRLLRIAYNIFMYGLVLTIIAFALAFVLPVNEMYAAG